ncbi:unnamed protein product [Camellia sinensis]
MVSFFPKDQVGGVGLVVRDSVGRFIRAKAKHLSHIRHVDVVEAIAIREGLRMLLELGCPAAVIEGDCQTIIDTINNS